MSNIPCGSAGRRLHKKALEHGYLYTGASTLSAASTYIGKNR